MNPAIGEAIENLLDHRSLSPKQTQAAFETVMDGEASEVEIASLLTALRMNGETVEEITGAARAMSSRARSEEHKSEVQSRRKLGCRRRLEKKKK